MDIPRREGVDESLQPQEFQVRLVSDDPYRAVYHETWGYSLGKGLAVTMNVDDALREVYPFVLTHISSGYSTGYYLKRPLRVKPQDLVIMRWAVSKALDAEKYDQDYYPHLDSYYERDLFRERLGNLVQRLRMGGIVFENFPYGATYGQEEDSPL